MTGFIALFGGSPGTGKTMQGAMYRDAEGVKKVIIDVENKAGVTINSLRKLDMVTGDIDVKCPITYDKTYKVDHIATYKKLIEIRDEILSSDYDVIVFDSVTQLRNSICANYYCAVNGKKQVGEQRWRDVNDNVREILETLVGYCRVTDKTLIMTCHMKDKYENNVCIGKTFDAKEFIEHYCDATFVLDGEADNTYTVNCTRSNCGKWSEDVSGRICLDMLFEDKGMI